MLPETRNPDLLATARLRLFQDQFQSRYRYYEDALKNAFHEADKNGVTPPLLAHLRLLLVNFSDWLEEALIHAGYDEGDSSDFFHSFYTMWLVTQRLLGSDRDDIYHINGYVTSDRVMLMWLSELSGVVIKNIAQQHEDPPSPQNQLLLEEQID